MHHFSKDTSIINTLKNIDVELFQCLLTFYRRYPIFDVFVIQCFYVIIICIGLFIVDVSFSDNERYLPFILGCQTVGNYRVKVRSVNQ